MKLTKVNPQSLLDSLPPSGQGRTKAILHFLADRYDYKYLTVKNYVRIGVFGKYQTMDDLILDLDSVDARIQEYKNRPKGSKNPHGKVVIPTVPKMEILSRSDTLSLKDRLLEMREKRVTAIAQSEQIIQVHMSNRDQLAEDLSKIDAVLLLLEKDEQS